MSGLVNNLGGLLNSADEPVTEEEARAAMDRAMEAAIEKHAAEKAAAAGEESSHEPRVKVTRSGDSSGVFGRRGS